MATQTLNFSRTQTAAWNQRDYPSRPAGKSEQRKSESWGVSKHGSLFVGHLAALKLIEHCSRDLSSPDHKIYLGIVRRHHEDAIRFLEEKLSSVDSFPLLDDYSDRSSSDDQSLPNDTLQSLALLKMAEKQLHDAHLNLFKDPSTPRDLQNQFGRKLLDNLSFAVEGIDRIQRSIP